MHINKYSYALYFWRWKENIWYLTQYFRQYISFEFKGIVLKRQRIKRILSVLFPSIMFHPGLSYSIYLLLPTENNDKVCTSDFLCEAHKSRTICEEDIFSYFCTTSNFSTTSCGGGCFTSHNTSALLQAKDRLFDCHVARRNIDSSVDHASW